MALPQMEDPLNTAAGGLVTAPASPLAQKVRDKTTDAINNSVTMYAATESNKAVQDAANQGNYGGALGKAMRAGVEMPAAMATDAVRVVKGGLLDPAANFLKTLVTGDTTPAGQEAPKPAVAAVAPAAASTSLTPATDAAMARTTNTYAADKAAQGGDTTYKGGKDPFAALPSMASPDTAHANTGAYMGQMGKYQQELQAYYNHPKDGPPLTDADHKRADGNMAMMMALSKQHAGDLGAEASYGNMKQLPALHDIDNSSKEFIAGETNRTTKAGQQLQYGADAEGKQGVLNLLKKGDSAGALALQRVLHPAAPVPDEQVTTALPMGGIAVTSKHSNKPPQVFSQKELDGMSKQRVIDAEKARQEAAVVAKR